MSLEHGNSSEQGGRPPEGKEINERAIEAVKKIQTVLEDLKVVPLLKDSDLSNFLKTDFNEKDLEIRETHKFWSAEVVENGKEFSVSLEFNPNDDDYEYKVSFYFSLSIPDKDPDIFFFAAFDAQDKQWRAGLTSETLSPMMTDKQRAQIVYQKIHFLPEMRSVVADFNISATEPTFVSEDQVLEIIGRIGKFFEKKFIKNTN